MLKLLEVEEPHKDRDLYDYGYLSLETKVNFYHLESRLKQTKTIDKVKLSRFINRYLRKRFDQIDYDIAKSDVRPFIKDQSI